MIRRILNRYRFTNSERRSLILLCVLLVSVNGVRFAINTGGDNDNHFSDPYEKTHNSLNAEPGQDTVPIKKHDKNLRYKAESEKIDINKADSTRLLDLYGIGPVFAGRITKYRNLLGGFYSCEQLLEVYGMDSTRYRGFTDRICIDSIGMTKLNINTAGFRELLRHPYLDYEHVRLLVRYRDKSGPLSSPLELWRDSVFEEDLKSKLLPYLKCR